MMKLIVLLLTISAFAANEPIYLKGQSEVSAQKIRDFQVSNTQSTKVGTETFLVETGNNNLLVNPSFEHLTFSTGWTNSAGTFTEETVLEIHGKKAAKLVLSSQTMSLSQSSTLYAAQFADGVQGLASVRVKSDVALKVCSIQAGVVSASLCVNVQSNNKWGLYKVPFILGATSNGISIASAGAVTGTVYIDDAFVGAASLTQNSNACQTANCTTEFIATFNSSGVLVSSNISGWIGNGSLATSTYSHTFGVGVFSAAPICDAEPIYDTAYDVSVSATQDFQNSTPTTSAFSFVSKATGGSSNVNDTPDSGYMITCIRQGADFTAAKQLSNGNTYSSTNADTDWASCTPTSSQGFTTPTFAIQCKRQGGDLLLKGNFTPTTTTAVEARIGLPLWNGVQLVSAGSSVIPSLQMAQGFYVRSPSSTSKGGAILIEPSVSYITFGTADTFSNVTASSLTKATGTAVEGSGTVSFNARIPIEGWQNSNIIIGQFNGLESCVNTLECTDTFSAKVSSAGVVSGENVDWINGNCAVASPAYTCSFNSAIFSVTPNCTATPVTNASEIRIASQSSSSISLEQYNSAGVAAMTGLTISCQKQGVDYIGKTAKAVASDQNVRSIGSTGMDIQSVYFGGNASCSSACSVSPCTICNTVGGKITSVSRSSAGTYLLNGIDGTKYNCSGSGVTNIYSGHSHLRASSTSSYAFLQIGNAAGSPTDSNYNSVTCIGIP